jgi:F-type H+-transporting ATPase subunit delta
MAALGGSVSRRYARALFELGVARGTFEQLGQELADLTALWGTSTDLRRALENPVFARSEKRAVLEQLLPKVTPSPDVRKFVLLLLDRRRISILPSIARAYREMADAHAGRVRAQVISAQPLSPAETDRVRRSLEQRTGKKVILDLSVDPSLIGGLVARVGDLVLDGSVRTQLATLRQRLLN